jgi:hypothetical protein
VRIRFIQFLLSIFVFAAMEDKRTKKSFSQQTHPSSDITNTDQINNQLNGKYSFSFFSDSQRMISWLFLE